jgi:threonine synthase
LRSSQLYYSTNLTSPEVTFREALLRGLAPDGGLYLPVSISRLRSDELTSLKEKSYYEIAWFILKKLIGAEINDTDLLGLCRDAYNFSIPLEKVHDRNYIMRLDQGPTASFKDFAARMMSRLMQYYTFRGDQHLTILTATSGDTGSAVASAFYGLRNISVIILFPRDEVSVMQRKQMTTFKENIRVIAVDGKFDDCQNLVKKAFRDGDLSHINMSSANSINIGRLLPQTVYYFYAWAKLAANQDDTVVFSVPSGNFGNLMGGLIAREMGLPVKKFIIATNENNEVPEFLRTGNYQKISPSKNCISTAMNVGHPGNLSRIIALYGGIMDENGNINKPANLRKMREDFFSVSATDEETINTISDIYRKFNILLEPHGAVAWYGCEEFLKSNSCSHDGSDIVVSLETAHPVKFSEELKEITGAEPNLPPSLSGLSEKPEEYYSLDNNYEQLKNFILKHN